MRGITGQQPRRVWAWKDIERAYRVTDKNKVRWVLEWIDGVGTCLVLWEGPKDD